MIRPKNVKEIEGMRGAGAMANTVLLETAKIITPGISTREIDEFAAECIERYKGCLLYTSPSPRDRG